MTNYLRSPRHIQKCELTRKQLEDDPKKLFRKFSRETRDELKRYISFLLDSNSTSQIGKFPTLENDTPYIKEYLDQLFQVGNKQRLLDYFYVLDTPSNFEGIGLPNEVKNFVTWLRSEIRKLLNSSTIPSRSAEAFQSDLEALQLSQSQDS